MDGLINRRTQGILQSPRSSFESSRPPSPDSAYSEGPLSDRDRYRTNRRHDWNPLSKTPKRLVKSSSEDFEENLPELQLRKGFTPFCTLDTTSTYNKRNYRDNRTEEGLRRSHSVTNIRKFDEDGNIKNDKINDETSDFENLKEIICEGIKSENRHLIKFALLFASDEVMRQICEKFCIEKPEKTLISHVIVEKIRIKFQAFIQNKCDVLRIWVGRQDKQHYGIDTIVVVINPPKPSDLKNTFWGLHLLVRCANECSEEASSILIHDVYDSASTLSVQIKDNEINSLFRKHSNISLINTSSVCSIGYSSHSPNNRSRIERVPSIVIYCHVKGVTPIGEETFPTTLHGHRIDVREAVCTFAVNPVQMSQEIKTENFMNTTKSGTLGGFVTLQNPERQCFLTCAHVVLPTAELTKEKLGKYALKKEIKVADEQKIRIGSVENLEFKHGTAHEVSIDAALIEITEQDRKPCNGEFAKVYTTEQFSGAGFSKENMPTFLKGEVEQIKMYNFRKPVLKIGARTGITLGSLKIGRSCARIFDFPDVAIEDKFSITLCKQMEVLPQIDPSLASDSREPFVDIGDSGSFVFFISHDNPLVLRCIGLAVAKTSYGSCIMTPIDKVFDALHLPYDCLSKFTEDVAQSEMYQSSLKDIFTILTDVSSKMATKNDIKNINEEMKKINDRLSTTESEVHILKEIQKDSAI